MIKMNGKKVLKGQINGKEIQKIVINGNTVFTVLPSIVINHIKNDMSTTEETVQVSSIGESYIFLGVHAVANTITVTPTNLTVQAANNNTTGYSQLVRPYYRTNANTPTIKVKVGNAYYTGQYDIIGFNKNMRFTNVSNYNNSSSSSASNSFTSLQPGIYIAYVGRYRSSLSQLSISYTASKVRSLYANSICGNTDEFETYCKYEIIEVLEETQVTLTAKTSYSSMRYSMGMIKIEEYTS